MSVVRKEVRNVHKVVCAGAASIVLGIRIGSLKMTSEPLVAMGGFLLAMLALPAYLLRPRLLLKASV